MPSFTRIVGFDTETHPIAPAQQAPKLVCLQTWEQVQREGVPEPEPLFRLVTKGAARAFSGLLVCPDVQLVGVNTAFDLAVMCQEDSGLFPLVFQALDDERIWDCAIFERLRSIAVGVREEGRWSLARLTEKYLKRDRSGEKKSPDSWRLRYRELEDVPIDQWPREAVEYCRADARDPVLIRAAQVAECGGKQPALFAESVRHGFAFYLMKAWGVRTDGEALRELRAKLRASINKRMPELRAAGIFRANGTEDTQVTKARVLAALGPDAPLTETGQKWSATLGAMDEATRIKCTATDARTIARSVEAGDRLLAVYAQVTLDKTELDTFVEKLEEGVERPIHPDWNALGTASFRSTCSKPNLQQLPRRPGVRECFVSRPGTVFVAADYSGAELCSFAQVLLDVFGESAMASALQRGLDLHLVFAADLMGSTYEEISDAYRRGDERAKALRQGAKAANFGIPGGMGSARLAQSAKDYGVSWSEEKAREIRERWLDRFPEVRRYFDTIGGLARGGLFEHVHPRTQFVRGGVGYCDGCNQGFQHLTAAGIKDAQYDVARECYAVPDSPLLGSRVVLNIHDELILEVPEEGLDPAARRLVEIMRQAMSRHTPDIPVSIEAVAMRRWSKRAKRVVKAGVLVPWEDRPCD